MTTEFYAFMSQWAKTQDAVSISSTTASDVLGTQTAASLYYTPVATTAASDSKTSQSGSRNMPMSLCKASAVLIAFAVLVFSHL